MKVYFFIVVTIISTVASQLLFKKGAMNLPHLVSSGNWFYVVRSVLLNVFILGGLMFSVISIFSWMIALSKVKLSYAYPFMSLTFPLVVLFSVLIYDENVSLIRWGGILIIMIGLIMVAKN